MLNKWRLAGARYFLLKKNLNSPILLLLTAFVIPSLGGTFTIYFINVQINIFCFSVLRSYYKKQQKTKSKRKSKKEKKREKKKKRGKAVLFTVGLLTVSLLVGRRHDVVRLMGWQELVPEADHDRCMIKTPFVVSLQNSKFIWK